MEQTDTAKIKITVGSNVFTARLNNNATATAFKARLPLSLDMADLNRNEKHIDLSAALPTGASKPGNIQTGDVMLYGTNTLVLFYKTFSSSYSYSPIGRIENPSELSRALGNGNVTVKFELN
ncbi:cyclophilin-like fold protein [Pedobacter sp. BMA]|uniref:cyclophilin-like fold protein n=1 Tax=Pedobacter sp. BMA TaxID=1663685 RepID=UPI001E590F72|nr:cyclophilin-like fold protein [Pedobacter sp. BMA]